MQELKLMTRKSLAQKAITKPPLLGENVDLAAYSPDTQEKPYIPNPGNLTTQEKQCMFNVGVVLDDVGQRAATFIQMDHSVYHSSTNQDGLEVLSTAQALKKHDWLEDYWWHVVKVDADKFTAYTELHPNNGYFIRALSKTKVAQPVQSCLYLAHNNLAQKIHNIVIAEEDSELHIITGCTIAPMISSGLHIGVTEIYVKRGAKVTFTMIHNWSPQTVVRPRTGIIVEEGGIFLSNYICMKPVRSLQMYPEARCVGENAVARFNNILVAPAGSTLDVGARMQLEAKGCHAESISHAITTGGTIFARGYILGSAPDVKGHLECQGLILCERGTIHAIPELEGQVSGVDLSHEAAIGKIAEEQLQYLMARGLNRAEATTAIVHGFLNVDIEGLPPQLSAEIKKAIESSEKGLF